MLFSCLEQTDSLNVCLFDSAGLTKPLSAPLLAVKHRKHIHAKELVINNHTFILWNKKCTRLVLVLKFNLCSYFFRPLYILWANVYLHSQLYKLIVGVQNFL